MMGGTDWDGDKAKCNGTEWYLTASVKSGGSIRVTPNIWPCAGNWTAVGYGKRWKSINLWDRFRLWHPYGSEGLGLVGSFSKVVMDTGPAFLGCLMMSARFGILDLFYIGGIPFDNNVWTHWVGWELGLRWALGLTLELADSVGRRDAPTAPTASFIPEIFRDFKGGIVENCSGDSHLGVYDPWCNILRDGWE